MKRLKNKVAMVFGAGPNIGGTVAHFLAREGARLVVVDIDQANADKTVEFLHSKGSEAIAFTADSAREDQVAHVVAESLKHYGQIDIVFNASGKIHWSPVTEMDVAKWQECLMSYSTAGMLTTKHAARAMIAAGRRGSIIHLLSTAAHFGEASGAAYTAAKGALLNFSRSAAMDLAHNGIRVNTITPCGMEHNLWGQMRDEIVDPNFRRPERRSFYSRDDFLKSIPLERFPRASDIAWAAVFLASEESSFITGADIPVDGGLRFKYPAWRPGDSTGVNIKDYAKELRITRFGEEGEKLLP